VQGKLPLAMRQVQGEKQTEFVNLLPDDFCRDKDREGGLLATFFCWMLPVLQLCQ
jgi:hypothetical protein